MKGFIKHISYPLVMKKNGNSSLQRHLKRLEESQYWSPARIEELQFFRLKELLRHAYRNTAFYKKRFDGYGFDPDRVQSLDDLRQLPILTKQDILDNEAGLRAKTFRDNDLVRSVSGGTTGIVTPFYVNKSCHAEKNA